VYAFSLDQNKINQILNRHRKNEATSHRFTGFSTFKKVMIIVYTRMVDESLLFLPLPVSILVKANIY
jgi:hypothetical protein